MTLNLSPRRLNPNSINLTSKNFANPISHLVEKLWKLGKSSMSLWKKYSHLLQRSYLSHIAKGSSRSALGKYRIWQSAITTLSIITANPEWRRCQISQSSNSYLKIFRIQEASILTYRRPITLNVTRKWSRRSQLGGEISNIINSLKINTNYSSSDVHPQWASNLDVWIHLGGLI